jgi:hypothetical protein
MFETALINMFSSGFFWGFICGNVCMIVINVLINLRGGGDDEE